MQFTERTETYWRDNRLYPVTILRPSGHGSWSKQHDYKKSELVAIITGKYGDFTIQQGPCATEERVNDSILLHQGTLPENFNRVAWKRIPKTLLKKLSNEISEAERNITDQWGQFSNEEAITGALFSQLQQKLTFHNWIVNLKFIEFSKQVKEAETGTDVAVILDVQTQDGMRSVKTLWLQAKSQKTFNGKLKSLPRFENQEEQAKKFTKDFYGIVYTPEGIYVAGTKIDDFTSLDKVINEAMQCRLGDTSIRTLKNSLNRKRIFEIILTEE